jgi:hypothetical protein
LLVVQTLVINTIFMFEKRSLFALISETRIVNSTLTQPKWIRFFTL